MVEVEDGDRAEEGREAISALFLGRLGGVPTGKFLNDPELVAAVSPIIQDHAEGEVAALQRRMTAPWSVRPSNESLRIGFTNISLHGFAGSELWTLEMASHMHRLGIPAMVYSPHLGTVAQKFVANGLAITDDPVDLKLFAPTVLHIHHQRETAAGRMVVAPDCRCVNMIHGLLPHPEWPGVEMDAYLAVSLHAKAKTALLGPAGWDQIGLLPNFFDPRRFGRNNAERAGKALLHSSRVTEANLRQMQSLLERQGLALDHIGYGGTVETNPEHLLPDYRVVFAAGRSAIEALACGSQVILWDQGIVGPAVTFENFWYVVAANFSVAACILPYATVDDPAIDDWLADQLASLPEPGPLCDLVHDNLTIEKIGQQLLTIYESL